MANTFSPLAAAERAYEDAQAAQEAARKVWWAIDWDNGAAEEAAWEDWQKAQALTKARYLDLLAATDAARETVHTPIVSENRAIATVREAP